ncbi:MAG TPA: CvpA family protein [Pirellulales bacterium]|nr:CvpA family protein [Pirellulales bacterium]
MNYLNIALILIFFAVLAQLVREGLWSNAIKLFNVMTAAMLATNYFEPLADWLTAKQPTFTYVWDLISVWAIFCVSLVVMQVITDRLSKVQVRFKKPVEAAGGIFFACWVGWLMICFTTFTLHLAPMSRSFLGDSFGTSPDDQVFFGLAPDRKWLAFMHSMSLDGSLAKSRAAGDRQTNVFDPDADFIFKYAASRERFEHQLDIRTRDQR